METNEHSFSFGGATEVQSPQTNFPSIEKMDVCEKIPSDHQTDAVTVSVDEEVKKPPVVNEQVNMEVEKPPVVNNEHAVNSTDITENDIDTVEESEEINSTSPAKVNAEPLNEVESKEDEVVTNQEVENSVVNEDPPPPAEAEKDVEMEEEKEEEKEEEPAESNSTPTEDGVMNDVQHSEDEMKVEDVSGDTGAADDVKESTAEPLVEEPAEGPTSTVLDDDKEEDDTDAKDDVDTKVEISDVTDKEEPVEEIKTDEELLLDHINTVYQCLDDFITNKDEDKIKDCMSLLTEIKSLTIKTVDSLKTFTAASKSPSIEKGHGSKKSKSRGKPVGKTTKTSKGEKNDIGGDSDAFDPLEEVNLKDIKGLAVFAKWPNSGWYYPGVVRDLTLNDWKTTQNITVTFYDGLERDMKSIHIFPAELIPTSSVLFDLDDETDMTVGSIEREENWVKYVLSYTGQPDVTKDFDKMAIKGANMKTIKQAVESSSDNANKSETLVSGRRARGKSSVFNEDYVSSSSPRSTEKRKTKVEDSKSTPAKTPAKRKSSSKDDEVGESSPSRSASKRRQVNGTKSTPRRAAKK